LGGTPSVLDITTSHTKWVKIPILKVFSCNSEYQWLHFANSYEPYSTLYIILSSFIYIP